MSRHKEVNDLLAELRAAGYEIRRAKGAQHYKVYDDGVLLTSVPFSPSDARWSKNARAFIRKRGSKPLPKLKHQRKREIMDTPRKDPA